MYKIIVLVVLLTSGASFAKELTLDSTTVNFNIIGSSRFTIEKAFMKIRCIRTTSLWEQLNNGLKSYTKCDGFKINEQDIYIDTQRIELIRSGDGNIKLPSLNIKYSSRRKAYLCLALSVKFDNVPTYSYPNLYKNRNDAFSLLSFCTRDKFPFSINDYVYNNRRVDNLVEFLDTIDRGVDLFLKP